MGDAAIHAAIGGRAIEVAPDELLELTARFEAVITAVANARDYEHAGDLLIADVESLSDVAQHLFERAFGPFPKEDEDYERHPAILAVDIREAELLGKLGRAKALREQGTIMADVPASRSSGSATTSGTRARI